MKISSTSLLIYLTLVERGAATTAFHKSSINNGNTIQTTCTQNNGAFLKPLLKNIAIDESDLVAVVQRIPRGGSGSSGSSSSISKLNREIDAIEERKNNLEDRVNTAMKRLGLSFDGVNNIPRGGDASTAAADTDTDSATDEQVDSIEDKRESLEDRVHAAMKKLGLSFDGSNNIVDTGDGNASGGAECEGGVCTLPPSESSSGDDINSNGGNNSRPKEDIRTTTKRIADEMQVDESIVLAAIGATLNPQIDGGNDGDESSRINEDAAKEMIQYEVDAIKRVMGDCEEVSVVEHDLVEKIDWWIDHDYEKYNAFFPRVY